MISFLKKILANDTKKKLIENVFSLSILQGANYVLALITLPYLTRVLGSEKFGLVMFAQAFIHHFIIITDFGFNLSATRAISLARNNRRELSEIYSAVMIIKVGLMCFCLLVLSLVVLGFEKFRGDWLLYLLSFGMVAGNVLFPVWFFQGMEKMKNMVMLNMIAKLIFTLSIFAVVAGPGDYLYVPFLNTLGFMTAGIVAVWTIFKKFKVPFIIPKQVMLITQFKEGWNIFISQVAISLYGSTNTIILGLLTNNTIVGYYAAAEKVSQAIKFAPSPIFQGIYPHCAMLAEKSKTQCVRFIRKITRYTLVFSLLTWSIVFYFADTIITLVVGSEYLPAVPIFRIFSVLIIVTPVAYLFFNIALLSFKLDKYFSRIYLSGAGLNFLFLLIFVGIIGWQANGIALSNMLAQLVITIIAYFTLGKHDIHLFFKRDTQ